MGCRSRLCKLVFCAMLAAASIGGTAMRPEEIEELMHSMNQQTITCTETGEDGEPLLMPPREGI
jgi:hypothetical protein